MEHTGLVHIYCGDGKGKTTAAIGLAVRCAGYGEQVLLVQFLKGWDSGELHALKRFPEITVIRGDASNKFIFQMNEDEKKLVYKQYNQNLTLAAGMLKEERFRMLILDEVMAAWNNNLLDRQLLLAILKNRPSNVEIVMTGQNPPEELTNFADYISQICKQKHPYDRGMQARKGIEF